MAHALAVVLLAALALAESLAAIGCAYGAVLIWKDRVRSRWLCLPAYYLFWMFATFAVRAWSHLPLPLRGFWLPL